MKSPFAQFKVFIYSIYIDYKLLGGVLDKRIASDRRLMHSTLSPTSEFRRAALPERLALPLEPASDGSDSS